MIKEYLAAIKYNITNVDTFMWSCYGEDIRCFDSYIKGKYECNAVVSGPDNKIRELAFYDYVKAKQYRWIDPEYRDAYKKEAIEIMGHDHGAGFCEVELSKDILEKMTAVSEGRDYDPRIIIPVDMTNEEFLVIAKAAHSLDITINEFVHHALVEALEYREQWKEWT